MANIEKAKESLILLRDIAVDYDGFRNPEDLMNLIDELRDYATTALLALEED